jgi:hypothetical protein
MQTSCEANVFERIPSFTASKGGCSQMRSYRSRQMLEFKKEWGGVFKEEGEECSKKKGEECS